MRKSLSSRRSRLACAGFTTGAVVTAVLVAPQAAYAAISVTPTAGPASGTVTVVDTTNNPFSGTPTVQLRTDACAGSLPAASASIFQATNAQRTGADTVSFTVPPLAAGPNNTALAYNVCIYNGSTLQSAGPTYQYSVSALSLTPTAGPVTGTITANLPGFLAPLSTATTGATFTTSACPATYTAVTASATAFNAVATKVNDDRATVPLPSSGPALSSGASRQYNLCIYSTNTGSGTLLGQAAYTVAPVTTVAPATGVSGGGNTLTVTAPSGITLPAGTLTATFASGSCPVVLPTSSNLTSPTVVRSSTGTSATVVVPAGVAGAGSTATPYAVCIYAGNTPGTSVLAATSGVSAYSVTLPRVDLTSLQGGAGTGSFFAQSTASFLTNAPSPGALFTAGERCPAVYSLSAVGGITPVAASARRVANNRAGITVPSGAVLVNSAPTPYQVCIYSDATSSGKLLSNSVYTVVVTPSVTGIVPNAGPSQGGATITVYGDNLPTTAGSIRATLGGSPLAVTPGTDKYFTAVTPMHAVANNVPLIVTTDVGSVTLNAAYDYVNSITVSPNNAPNTVPTVDVVVSGVGFLSLPFAAVNAAVDPNTSDAHVYLVDGVYNPASVTGNGSGPKANGPVAECGNVQVVTDTELFCTLQLNQRRNAAGTFVLPAARGAVSAAVIDDIVTTAGSPIITSAAEAQFTQADVGTPIVGVAGNTVIPAGTTIVSVSSPTTAIMSANALLTGTTTSVDIGGPLRSGIGGTLANGNQITLTTGFTQADVGRVITGAGIPTGSTITAVNNAGTVVTLSQAYTTPGAISGSNGAVSAPSPVPNGAYTMTVVSTGALNAATNPAVTDYSQSVISSGSTFTVAPF